jgi:hypothetical protein
MQPPLCSGNSFTIKIQKMNTTELKGNWDEQKGKLKQKFPVLTETNF